MAEFTTTLEPGVYSRATPNILYLIVVCSQDFLFMFTNCIDLTHKFYLSSSLVTEEGKVVSY